MEVAVVAESVESVAFEGHVVDVGRRRGRCRACGQFLSGRAASALLSHAEIGGIDAIGATLDGAPHMWRTGVRTSEMRCSWITSRPQPPIAPQSVFKRSCQSPCSRPCLCLLKAIRTGINTVLSKQHWQVSWCRTGLIPEKLPGFMSAICSVEKPCCMASRPGDQDLDSDRPSAMGRAVPTNPLQWPGGPGEWINDFHV